jgi:hypothetical protein
MSEAIPPLPQYALMGLCLVKKHRDNFTFSFPELLIVRMTVLSVAMKVTRQILVVIVKQFMLLLVHKDLLYIPLTISVTLFQC